MQLRNQLENDIYVNEAHLPGRFIPALFTLDQQLWVSAVYKK